MRALDREVLAVVLLNTRLRLIKFEKLSQGTVNETLAHPREILKPAIIHSAYAFILVHNHPSGDATPSDMDRRLTRAASLAATTVHIQLLDHLVMGAPAEGRTGYFSFKEAQDPSNLAPCWSRVPFHRETKPGSRRSGPGAEDQIPIPRRVSFDLPAIPLHDVPYGQ
jgi:proteasome lid subunit RPN8/RPN11